MSVTATKAKVGRPRGPLDIADARELARIATLASSILICLRKQGRGVYSSERELRKWLDEDGTVYSASDLAPALGLLAECGKIGRHAAKPNVSLAGWLITEADAALSGYCP